MFKSIRILKKKIKSDLKEHYDSIRNEIDFNKNNLLFTISKTSFFNNEDVELEKDKIIEIYELLFEKINQIYENNLIELDNIDLNRSLRRDISYEIEDIKKKAFNKFCLFLKYEDLGKKMRDLLRQHYFGVLIEFDTYLDENQQNYIK
jgi:hypothetical protein